jgi:hypothetical protein
LRFRQRQAYCRLPAGWCGDCLEFIHDKETKTVNHSLCIRDVLRAAATGAGMLTALARAQPTWPARP